MNTIAIMNNIENKKLQGGTFNAENGRLKNFSTGYLVSITNLINGTNHKHTQYTLGDIERLMLSDKINTFKRVFGKLYVGFWVNEFNNETYFDITIRVNTKKESIELAEKGKEIAIWDNKNKKEIYRNGNSEWK